MRKIFLLPLLGCALCACNYSKSSNIETDNKETADTITTEQVQPQQTKPVSEQSAGELESFFDKQISGAQTLVQAKGISTSTNGIYCYFRLKNDKATALRMHMQFWEEQHASANGYTFNLDGKEYKYMANRNRSGANDSRITETSTFHWYDSGINKSDIEFLKALTKSENATVTLVNRATGSVLATITISETEKDNIRKTLDYYYALDGALIPRKGMVNIRQ